LPAWPASVAYHNPLQFQCFSATQKGRGQVFALAEYSIGYRGSGSGERVLSLQLGERKK